MPRDNPITRKIFPIFVAKENPIELVEFRGTGFFVDSSGLFLTALHVVNRHFTENEKLYVMFENASIPKEYAIFKILGFDAHQDGYDMELVK